MILTFKNFVPQISGDTFIAENSVICGNVCMKKNSSLWFNAVVRSENERIIIGENSNIQDNCTVHSSKGFPVIIGNNVSVGHNAVIHGCEIGDNCLIGMNSTILNGAKIGKNSIIGAGALVPQNKEFPDNALLIGVPARAVKTLDADTVKSITKNAEHYAEIANEYKKILK